MSWPASGTCFYCGNPINRLSQRYVHAVIEHEYKHGGTRTTDRNFHVSCFEKFETVRGRPYNPHTNYEVLESEEVTSEIR
jgi:hypothetical protein